MQSESPDLGGQLNRLLAEAGTTPLTAEQLSRFELYISLFIRWNNRINLSSIRDPESILSRHFVESIICGRTLPNGISTLLDFGSGGGLPGIPIAISRPEIVVTLAESQGKKAAFLREAVRSLGISSEVFADRAENLTGHFDCVTLRAVDRMTEAVRAAATLVDVAGWLALMTTHSDLPLLREAVGTGFDWTPAVRLPFSADRIVALSRRLG